MIKIDSFFWLLSFFLYVCAPVKFNISFSLLILLLYCINCLFFFKKNYSNLGYYNFSLMFCISFLLCNFVYPVFVHPYFPIGLMVHDFDDSYICRGAALAQLGISSFLFVENRVLMKCPFVKEKKKTILRNDVFDILTLSLIWIYALFVFFLSGISYNLYNEILDSSLTLISLVHILTIVTIIYRCSLYRNKRYSLFCIFKREWLLLTGLFVAFVGLTRIGDRGPILQLSFAIFTSYYFLVGRVSLKRLLIVLIVGLLGMIYIRNNRIDGQYQAAMEYREQKYGTTLPFYIEIFTDLIGNARCMYTGLEYVDKYGYLNGKSFIKPMLAPVPFLPTLATQSLFNVVPSQLSTGTILTYETEVLMGRNLEGVGTNNVVDIYMNAGLGGVCLLMGLFGGLIGVLETRKGNNVYFLFCYCILMSIAIYIPRSTIFDFFRTVLWGVFILYIRNRFPNKFKCYELAIHK
ncbi:hypothetical protein [uncultured Bacteroides sp.]|uniref:hypothetical protein n=1 Tax=uncultured Bacteroides sp. TaxID=162156 RepID=UPI0026022B41|nr:hypothetical protein [uncultured Bacteroides sp.]